MSRCCGEWYACVRVYVHVRAHNDNMSVHVGVSGVNGGVTERNEAHSQLAAISMHNFHTMLTIHWCTTFALPTQFSYVWSASPFMYPTTVSPIPRVSAATVFKVHMLHMFCALNNANYSSLLSLARAPHRF